MENFDLVKEFYKKLPDLKKGEILKEKFCYSDLCFILDLLHGFYNYIELNIATTPKNYYNTELKQFIVTAKLKD